MHKTQDLHVKDFTRLMAPRALKEDLPITEADRKFRWERPTTTA